MFIKLHSVKKKKFNLKDDENHQCCHAYNVLNKKEEALLFKSLTNDVVQTSIRPCSAVRYVIP